MADENDQTDRSDYFHWTTNDVHWETSPQAPPAIPVLPEDESPTLPDFYARETGADRFFSLSKEQQDAALGPETAEEIRTGRLKLSDLVARNSMKNEPDFISQASLNELGIEKPEKK